MPPGPGNGPRKLGPIQGPNSRPNSGEKTNAPTVGVTRFASGFWPRSGRPSWDPRNRFVKLNRSSRRRNHNRVEVLTSTNHSSLSAFADNFAQSTHRSNPRRRRTWPGQATSPTPGMNKKCSSADDCARALARHRPLLDSSHQIRKAAHASTQQRVTICPPKAALRIRNTERKQMINLGLHNKLAPTSAFAVILPV